MSATLYWSERDSRALPEGGDSETLVVGELELDLVEQDTYDVAATVTAHAVEQGVAVSDHVIPQQDRATVTVLVSGRQSTTRLIEGARHGTFERSNEDEGTGVIVPEGSDRRGDVHDTLRRLCRGGVEVDVDGLRRPIEGWLLESVSSPRTVETTGLLVCDLTLVEVRYAEVEEVEAPSPRVERGRQRRDRGRQAGTPTEGTASAEAGQRESVLHSLIGSLTGSSS